MEQRVGIHMPVALDILHSKHEACQNEAVDVYRQTSIFDEKINKYAAKLEVIYKSCIVVSLRIRMVTYVTVVAF